MSTDALLERINAHDIGVFTLNKNITARDKRAFLAVQTFLHDHRKSYSYLELGSQRGGTLLPHLADPACTRAASVDPDRVTAAPAGEAENDALTAAALIDSLAAHLPFESLAKLRTYDCHPAEMGEFGIDGDVTLALIDRERTNTAAFADFLAVRPYLARDSLVLIHDTNLVFEAVLNIEAMLRFEGRRFRGWFLPGLLYLAAFGRLAKPAAATFDAIAMDRDWWLPRARRKLAERIARDLGGAGKTDIAAQ